MKVSDQVLEHPRSVICLSTPLRLQQEAKVEERSDSQSISLIEVKQGSKVKANLKQLSLVCNISDTRYSVVKKVCKKLGLRTDKKLPEGANWDLMWTDNVVQPEDLSKMGPHQKINHFPGMYCLSRKNHLGRNLMKMRKKFQSQYNFFPLTWMLPSDISDLRGYAQKTKNSTFIVKPQASCQGKGIFLVKNIQDIPHNQHYVVQKYLTKPFLIDELKFDFRIYVLVAGCNPLRIYLYNEGLTRFATEKYTAPNKSNIQDGFMHLTNYAINKGNQKFIYNESEEDMTIGHKRSLSSVIRMLDDMGHSSAQFWKKTKDMIIKTLISGQPILSHHYKSCQPQNYANNMCFEVLGLDVMLDSQCNPYLLQVNYTPSFSTDTPLDKTIKYNLIKDSIELMNITSKIKRKIQSDNKDTLMKRMLSGKKQKLTPQQKQTLVQQAQRKRDKWEDKHLGGFEKIYPLPGVTEKYGDFLKYSDDCYLEQTGANIRRNCKKQKQKDKQPVTQVRKESATDMLAKVYTKPRPRTAVKRIQQPYKRERSEMHTEDPFDKQANQTLEYRGEQFVRHPKASLYTAKSRPEVAVFSQAFEHKRSTGSYIQPRLFMLSPFNQ